MVLSDYGYGKFRETQLKCIECDLLGVEYFLTLYTADERECPQLPSCLVFNGCIVVAFAMVKTLT